MLNIDLYTHVVVAALQGKTFTNNTDLAQHVRELKSENNLWFNVDTDGDGPAEPYIVTDNDNQLQEALNFLGWVASNEEVFVFIGRQDSSSVFSSADVNLLNLLYQKDDNVTQSPLRITNKDIEVIEKATGISFE